ncbi:MAG: TetR/AcrR family transcriptional regulator [Chloroflexota bacterium]
MDPREVRSRKRLRMALFTLLQQKPIDSIPVAEIVETADVTLPTLYRHYADKFDLLQDIIQNIPEFYGENVIPGRFPISSLFDPSAPPPIMGLVRFIEQNRAAFKHMLQLPASHVFLRSSYVTAKQVVLIDTPAFTEVEVELIVATILGSIYQWLILDQDDSAVELANRIHKQSIYGVLMLRDENDDLRQQLIARYAPSAPPTSADD